MNTKMQTSAEILTAILTIALFCSFQQNATPPRARYSIGLVYIPTLAYHKGDNDALKVEIKKDGRFGVKEFTAASIDPMLISASCEEALRSNVDVIVCSGASCSRELALLSQKREIVKPIIFMGVGDPVELGLVSSLEKPSNGNITGVLSVTGQDTVDIPELLLTLKPSAATVLLPYAIVPGGNEKWAHEIAESLKTRGVNTTLLPITTLETTLPTCAGLLPGHDTMLYLEADAIASFGAGLGKLASQHNVTMFASSIEGAEDAAFSYAAPPASFGRMAFRLAKEVLCNGKHAGAIPVVACPNRRVLRINKALFPYQGLNTTSSRLIAKAIENNPKFSGFTQLY